MKTRIQGVMLTLALVLTFTSCKKESTPPPPPSTSLKITVKDGRGLTTASAIVKLYLSQQDLLNDVNQVGGSKVTDMNGVVTFTDLSPVKYYWKIESGCQNNLNGVVSSPSPLTSGVINTVIVELSETGTLRMVNNSNYPFNVYANGILVIDNMPGKSSRNLTSAPTGSWNIRVVQQSGFALYPTDKTYTGSLSCGAILTTTFTD